MSDMLNKFTQFLDQLWRLIESLPMWLKLWIYILIFFVFVTIGGIAVFYLVSKERLTLKHFSVEKPVSNDTIPLGENKTWILEGNFPVVDDDKISTTAKIEVEVFKTEPSREAVAQSGKTRISTVEGIWSYESAHFAGDGLHEIVVSAYIGNKTVYRRCPVQCIKKAAAYKNSIENDRKRRGALGVSADIRNTVNLRDFYRLLEELQNRFFAQYPNQLDSALQTVSQALDEINKVLPLYPNDLFIQNVRAYMFKNQALVMQRLNRTDEFDHALQEAAKMFDAVREQNPNDAGAWNGLGNVYLLRNDPRKALRYINRAIEIEPGYTEAINDRQIAVGMLKTKGKGGRPLM